jgi:hypothetical protein
MSPAVPLGRNYNNMVLDYKSTENFILVLCDASFVFDKQNGVALQP